ncbi:GHMP kinase [Halteromyces radiatus]|uniref:GHMP kinase n=1 Tax=Halteromyces radiatus TaxID=101107 RepID=UPI0022205C8C|nr:GHMP kinase [Halteromyces radiatus]KAI8099806.1 GHMP kinase [Halteromyces radiatus]
MITIIPLFFFLKHAVAASLGLRTHLYIERTQDSIFSLDLSDVAVSCQWSLSDFPWDLAQVENDDHHPINDMTPTLKKRLQELAGDYTNPAQEKALMAFLYLVMTLVSPLQEKTGFKICCRSFLPVGAGLGSSASYSVVLATALLITFGYIPVDFASSSDKIQYLETINRYAFKAEQVIHGNPSGVDNAVAAFGGAKTFLKGKGFSTLEGFKSLRLLLTNTKVPRSTSALVEFAANRKAKYPHVIDPIMDAIDGVSIRCKDAFLEYQNGTMDSLSLVTELEELVDMNHCLLYALGVTHPSLEKIRRITASHGLITKLTGAGGGGCAVTIIRDDVDQETITKVMELLEKEGFDCYQTSVGGTGVEAVTLTPAEDIEWMINADKETLENKFL